MRIRRSVRLAALLIVACQQPPGRKLASGIGSRIAVQEGVVAFLLDAAHPDDRAVPEDLAAGDLWLDARKVGSGVSSQAGAYDFSRRGELAFLASWRFRAGEGELWTAAPGAEPAQVAPAARSFAWSPDGSALAYVGPQKLGLRGKFSLAIDGLREIAWSPDGKRIAARTSAPAGGKLNLVYISTGPLRAGAPGTTAFRPAPPRRLA